MKPIAELALSPIDGLLADPTVTEIMVNGPSRIYVERGGKLELTDLAFADEAALTAAIDRIFVDAGRPLDVAHPYADAALADGSRVNAVIRPLALDGPLLTVRKFSREAMGLEDLERLGSVTPNAAQFLSLAVRCRRSLVIAGGTGTGKTTLLNVLSAFVPETERILTIEDTAELRLKQPHVVRLEVRPEGAAGGAVTVRELVRNALRMRPDRIIVGECRGSEALDMLQAMNTGHEGSLTTIHANSPADVFARLETMVMLGGTELPSAAVRAQIGSALDLVVQLERLATGRRQIKAIAEVMGSAEGRLETVNLFARRLDGSLAPTGAIPSWFERIRECGFECPAELFDPAFEGEVRVFQH